MEWEQRFTAIYEEKIKNPNGVLHKYASKLANETEDSFNAKAQNIISAEALKDTITYYINTIEKKYNLSLTFKRDDYLNIILDSVNQIEDLSEIIQATKKDFHQTTNMPEVVKIDYQLVKTDEQYLGFGKNVKSQILSEEIGKFFEEAVKHVPNDKMEQIELLNNIKDSLSLFEDFYKPVVFDKDKLKDMITKSSTCGLKFTSSTITSKEYILQNI